MQCDFWLAPQKTRANDDVDNHAPRTYQLGRRLQNSASSNVHVLDNQSIVIEDVRFLGSILWTDFQLFGEIDKWFSIQRARQCMNDFAVISLENRLFTPADSIALHESGRSWLRESWAEPFEGKTVVVTHHAPSARSVPKRFAGWPRWIPCGYLRR